MIEYLEFILKNLPAFMLISLRASGIFLSAPIFGSRQVPAQIKIIFAFTLTFILYNFIPKPASIPTDIILYIITGMKEILVGIIFGWTSSLLFEGIILAGQFIGLQMAFGQANILNPESERQIPLLSEFYFIFALLIFFSIDGHLWLITSFYKSFNTVPLGTFVFVGSITQRILVLFAQIFLIALIIAAPICGVLTIVDLIMGLIARTMPQLNVLILGFAIKIYLGLFTIFLSLPLTADFVKEFFNEMLKQIIRLI